MGNSSSKPIVQPQYDSSIPPAFHFTRTRHMVIACSNREFHCFPTEHSYERRKNTRKSGAPVTLDDGALGVPLLTLERSNLFQRAFDSDAPYCRIYKYMLQKSSEAPLNERCEMVHKSGELVLYKMPFCEVKKSWSRGLRTCYELSIWSVDGIQKLVMIEHRWGSDLDTKIGPWNVQWRQEGFESFSLTTIPDEMPSLLDDEETIKRKKQNKTKISDSKRYLCAKFSTTGKSHTLRSFAKLADLCVGEIDIETDAASYGLYSVPWYTQVTACMGLILTLVQMEKREDRNKRSRRRMGSGFTLNPLGPLNTAGPTRALNNTNPFF